MGKVEAVCRALAERGDLPCEELAAFVQARCGVRVEPRVLPVIRAMLRDREALAASREGRAAAGP